MKIACLSDLHLIARNPQCRTDDLVELQWHKLKEVFNTAAAMGCKAIVQAGDITDRPRSWKLLPRLADFLAHDWGMRFYCVYGQHDTYMYSEENRDRTNIGVLAEAGLVKVLCPKPMRFGTRRDKVRLYGVSWGQEVPTPKIDGTPNVLVIHASIGPVMYPGHNTSSAFSFARDNKFDLIVCGDVHSAFHELLTHTIKLSPLTERHIINTGPLVRKSADEVTMQHQPHFYVWDSKTKECEIFFLESAPAPRDVISREHINDEEVEDHTELVQRFSDAMSADTDGINIEAMILNVSREFEPSQKTMELIAQYITEAQERRQ